MTPSHQHAGFPSFVLDLIYRMKVKDVMTKDLVTAEKEVSLRTIQRLMKEHLITGVPIMEAETNDSSACVHGDIINALDGGYIEDPAERHMTRNIYRPRGRHAAPVRDLLSGKIPFRSIPRAQQGPGTGGLITSRDIIVALLVEVKQGSGKTRT
jgi:CBS domain-containing protein